MREVKINILNGRKEKEKKIKSSAESCLKNKAIVSNFDGDLSEQIFSNGSTLYLNPTERMHISNLAVNEGVVATVLGSGDFMIDHAFHGADEILTFDINKNQYFMASLKLKALQNMGYSNYWEFLCDSSSEELLSLKIYNELKKCGLNDSNLYAFMDVIIKEREREVSLIKNYQKQLGLGSTLEDARVMMEVIGNDSMEYLGYPLLNESFRTIIPNYTPSTVFSTICGLEGSKTKDTYLQDEEAYKLAQKRIKEVNISFVKSDIAHLKNVLDNNGYTKNSNFEGFDSIYLSNIPEYINREGFMHTLDTQLMPLLKKGGLIGYCVQGTSKESLLMNDDELNNLKNEACIVTSSGTNPFALYQKINSVEIFRELTKDYDVDIMEEDTIAHVNGIDNKDTFVYVKK